MKEHNVIGTMQLLAACQRAPGLERLVVQVLRGGLRLVSRATRRCSPRTWRRGGCRGRASPRTSLEVEGYVRGFARRRPDVGVTMLRSAPTASARRSTPRYAATSRLPADPEGARLRRRGCSCCTRTTLLGVAAPRHAGRRRRHLQRRRRRRADAVAGDPPARPAVRAAAAPSRWASLGSAVRPPASALADFSPEQVAVPHLRPRPGHHPDARRARLRARVHHRAGVRRLRRRAAARHCSTTHPVAGARGPASTGRARRSTVADAEIIPLGTRGRPGRGTRHATTVGSSSRDSRRRRQPEDGAPRRATGCRADASAAAEPIDGPRSSRPSEPVELRREPSRRVGRAAGVEPRGEDRRRAGPADPVGELLAHRRRRGGLRRGRRPPPRRAAGLPAPPASPATTRSTSSASTPSSPTASCSPLLRPLAEKWFRVEVRGVENIPTDGGALVVANHSGHGPARRR